MTDQTPPVWHARQDIHRAEFLLSLNEGFTREDSVHALKYRAAVGGVSVHTAALRVLSDSSRPEPAATEPAPPAQIPRHLFAVASGSEIDAADASEIDAAHFIGPISTEPDSSAP
jgi:hypothetical protein